MLFGLFKKRKNDEFTKTKKVKESNEKFDSTMSQKERNDIWDKKLEREQALARKEDIEEEKRLKAIERKNKIKNAGKATVRGLGHSIEGVGIIANKTADIEVKTAKKIYKKGKPAAKTILKDMTHASKVAAKGLGDWADRVAEDELPRKRKTTTKRRVIKNKTKAKRKQIVRTKPVTGTQKRKVKHSKPAKRKQNNYW